MLPEDIISTAGTSRPEDPTKAEASGRELLLMDILNSSASGILAFQSRRNADNSIVDFECISINRTAERMLGRQEQEFTGKSLLDFFPLHLESGLFEKYRDLVQEGTADTSELLYTGADGDTWLSAAAVRLGDGVVITLSDISERKKTEKNFKRAEIFLEKVTDVTPGLITVFNVASGRYIYVNNAISQILGYSPEDFLKGGFEFAVSLVHPDDFMTVTGRNQAAIERANREYPDYDDSAIVEFEYRMRHKDGSYRWIHTYGTIFSRTADHQVDQILNISVDISARKAVEERIAENEAFLHESQSIAQVGSFRWDIRYEKNNYSTPVFKKIFGYEDDGTDHNMQFFFSILHPDDRKKVTAALKDSFENHTPYECEYRIQPKGQDLKYILTNGRVQYGEDGKPDLMIGTILDITKIRLAEEELRENRHFINQIADISSNLITVTDLAEKKLVYVNENFAKLLGCTKEELYRGLHSFMDKVHPDDIAKLKERIGFFENASPDDIYEIEYRAKSRSGEWRWLYSRSSVFKLSSDGKVAQFISTGTDITERKIAEEKLRESQHFVQAITDSMPNIIYVYDLVEERNVYANRELVHMLGYSSEALEDAETVAKNLIHPEDREIVRKRFQKFADAADGELIEDEFRVRDVHGAWHWINSRATVFKRTPDGKVWQVVGSAKEITERKLAEEKILKTQEELKHLNLRLEARIEERTHELALSEANLREAQRISHMGNWDFDPQSGHINWSEELFHIHGLDPAQREPGYEEMLKLFPESHILDKKVQDALKGIPFNFDAPIVLPDGSLRYVQTIAKPVMDRNGNCIRLYGTTMDITERKLAEKALRESQEQLHLITNAIPALVAYIDKDERYHFVNKAYTDWYGPGAADARIGSTLKEGLGATYEKIEHRFREVLSGKSVDYETELPVYGGKILYVNAKYIPDIASDGEVRGFVALVLDITERVKAEEELKIRAQVLANMSEGVSLSDETGIILYTNPAEDRIFGYEPGELVGQHVSVQNDYLPEENLAIVNEVIGDLKTYGVWSGEFRNKKKDGTPFITQARITSLEISGKLYWICVQEDISEEKEAQQALEAQHRIIRTITDNTAAALFMMDGEGRVNFMNPAAEKITGWTSAELNGKVLHEAIHYLHPDGMSFPIAECPIGKSYETHLPLSAHEDVFIRKDGSFYPVSCSIAPIIRDEQVIGAVLEFRDITAEKEAQRALVESEERFRAVSESIPNIIWTALPDGSLDYYNQRWYEYTGLSYEETAGWGWTPVVHPDDMPHCLEIWENSLKTGQVYEIEYRFRGSDGNYRWYLGRAVPIRDTAGNIIKWFGSGTDIQDYKELEEELNRSKAELELRVQQRTGELLSTNKELLRSNEDLEQFAYVASHDLKEPLRMIHSYSQLLQKRYVKQLDDEANEFFGYVIEGAGRMGELLSDLLEFSRIGRADTYFRSVDCNEIIALVQKNLRAKIESSSATIICEDLPSVKGVPSYFTQLFQNLVENAIKFAGDKVPEVRISAEKREDEWVFSFKDNGIGMEPQYLERIFVIFQRLHTREEYPGTGIGLSICKKIVEFHGGRIWAESEPGQGTSFYFTIPCQHPL